MALIFCALSIPLCAQTINITSAPYNASNGSADNATAIQGAINAVGANGTVLVPAGTFYSGPVTLKSNMIFQISAGATLMMLPMTATGSNPAYPPSTDFLYGSNLTNITINGAGVMDGQGLEWWTYFNGGGTDNRPPAMIELSGCTGVTVSGITVQNSPKFHIQFLGNGANILASGLSITAPWPSPNTDGIDLRGTNVNIQNCYISDGDDVVQIGGSNACNGVTVEGCTFGTGHGLSIGSITSGGVTNVQVNNCVFTGTQYGLRLKSNNTEGGTTTHITYSNITMSNILLNPILMYSYYPTVPSSPATDTGSAANSTTPYWENIIFQNVTASQASTGTANVGMVWGLPQAPVSNVLFDACTLTGSKIFDVFNTQGITFDCNCLINGKPPSNTAAVTTYNAAMAGTDDVAFPLAGPRPLLRWFRR
jgi:polygalacturonase